MLDDGISEIDFTKYFNVYAKGILESKSLTLQDIIAILCKVNKLEVNLSNFTLKCMLDNTFTEIVFKENDTISSILSS
jgi:hypothetical protein